MEEWQKKGIELGEKILDLCIDSKLTYILLYGILESVKMGLSHQAKDEVDIKILKKQIAEHLITTTAGG